MSAQKENGAGTMLVALLHAKGASKADFARAIDRSPQVLNKYFQKNKLPGDSSIRGLELQERAASFFGVPRKELCNRDGTMKPGTLEKAVELMKAAKAQRDMNPVTRMIRPVEQPVAVEDIVEQAPTQRPLVQAQEPEAAPEWARSYEPEPPGALGISITIPARLTREEADRLHRQVELMHEQIEAAVVQASWGGRRW